MSDAVKWAILGVVVVGLLATIIALTGLNPDFGGIISAYNDLIAIIRPYTSLASGLIGYVFPPQLHGTVLAVLAYIIIKPFVKIFINLLRGIYAWVFK